jgi:hypothetical protein
MVAAALVEIERKERCLKRNAVRVSNWNQPGCE